MRLTAILAPLLLVGWVINPGTTVNLHWAPASGPVVGYDVLRDGEVIATTTGPTWTWDDCPVGEEIALTVRAFDADGNRGPVAEVSKPFRCFDTLATWQPDADGDGEIDFTDLTYLGRAYLGGETIAGDVR